MSMYTCPCGCTFAPELGAYGCPNCLGDHGPASISDGANAEFFYRTITMTRQELESQFPYSPKPSERATMYISDIPDEGTNDAS